MPGSGAINKGGPKQCQWVRWSYLQGKLILIATQDDLKTWRFGSTAWNLGVDSWYPSCWQICQRAGESQQEAHRPMNLSLRQRWRDSWWAAAFTGALKQRLPVWLCGCGEWFHTPTKNLTYFKEEIWGNHHVSWKVIWHHVPMPKSSWDWHGPPVPLMSIRNMCTNRCTYSLLVHVNTFLCQYLHRHFAGYSTVSSCDTTVMLFSSSRPLGFCVNMLLNLWLSHCVFHWWVGPKLKWWCCMLAL